MLINLKPFLDGESRQYRLSKPWRNGEHVYATDGRGLLQLELQLFPDAEPYEGQRAPDTETILQGLSSVSEWHACEPLRACDACNNTGKIYAQCDICLGTGTCECDCGHEHDCAACDNGQVLDHYCKLCRVRFGGKSFQRRYFEPVIGLPGFCIAINPQRDDLLLFSFEGGAGAVMCIHDED